MRAFIDPPFRMPFCPMLTRKSLVMFNIADQTKQNHKIKGGLNMPDAAAVFLFEEDLVMVGGLRNYTHSIEHWQLHTYELSLEPKTDLPTPRAHSCGCALNSEEYVVIGGLDGLYSAKLLNFLF